MSDFQTIAVAVAFMAAFGTILSLVLVAANKKLFVYEDPRIDDVEDMLPHANCGACGDCVDICPKDLFEVHPVGHRLWIACKNKDFGDDAENLCDVACTACQRCSVDAPEGLIRITGNLATIDCAKNTLASRVAMERCPTGAIVWLDDKRGIQKSRNAKKVIRKEALPVR